MRHLKYWEERMRCLVLMNESITILENKLSRLESLLYGSDVNNSTPSNDSVIISFENVVDKTRYLILVEQIEKFSSLGYLSEDESAVRMKIMYILENWESVKKIKKNLMEFKSLTEEISRFDPKEFFILQD
ncbi:hypothetical protein HZS_6218, partial [Henneguya salminicola]